MPRLIATAPKTRSIRPWLRARAATGSALGPAAGTLAVSTRGSLTNLFGGQTVEVTGVLGPPKGAIAEGTFDYRAYLSEQGIYYRLQAASSGGTSIRVEVVRHGKGVKGMLLGLVIGAFGARILRSDMRKVLAPLTTTSR